MATFYSLIFRRQVGRHVILVCDSVSCWVMGYENLKERLLKRLGLSQLGQTTTDGRFTVLPAACLARDRAPAMMVDGDLYGPVEEGRDGGLEGILGRYA